MGYMTHSRPQFFEAKEHQPQTKEETLVDIAKWYAQERKYKKNGLSPEAKLSRSQDDINQDFDAFQDRPFSEGLIYVAADALFPNSKFILSIRDSDAWFNSLTSFHRKIYGIDTSQVSEQDIYEKCNYLYKDYFYGNKKRFLTTYERGETKVNWSKLYDKYY